MQFLLNLRSTCHPVNVGFAERRISCSMIESIVPGAMAHTKQQTPVEPGFVRNLATACGSVPVGGIPPRGLENSQDFQGVHGDQGQAAAKSGAAQSSTCSRHIATDPGLARIVQAWPTLPANLRAAILALID